MDNEEFFYYIAKADILSWPAKNRSEWLFCLGLIETWYHIDDDDE